MNNKILVSSIISGAVLIAGIIIYNRYYKRQVDLMVKDAETQAQIEALKEQLKNAKNNTVSKKIADELVKKTTSKDTFQAGDKIFALQDTNVYFSPAIDKNYRTLKKGQQIGTYVRKYSDYLSLVKWDSNIGNTQGTGAIYDVYIPTKNISK